MSRWQDPLWVEPAPSPLLILCLVMPIILHHHCKQKDGWCAHPRESWARSWGLKPDLNLTGVQKPALDEEWGNRWTKSDSDKDFRRCLQLTACVFQWSETQALDSELESSFTICLFVKPVSSNEISLHGFLAFKIQKVVDRYLLFLIAWSQIADWLSGWL